MTETSNWQAYYAAHLAKIPPPPVAKKQSPNLRPPGLIRHGSATHAVLEFFKANPRIFIGKEWLVYRTNHTTKAADWALSYLRLQNLIERASSDPRNPRYFQYRLKEGAHAQKVSEPQVETIPQLAMSTAVPVPQLKFQRYCEQRRAGVSDTLATAEVLPDLAERQDVKVESHELVEPPEPDFPVNVEQLQPESASAPVEPISLLPQGKSAWLEDDELLFLDEDQGELPT